MSLLAGALLLGATGAAVVAPLLPALVEWRRRRDAQPLRVVREYEGDIRYFAHRFRAYLRDELERRLSHGQGPDPDRFLILRFGPDGGEGRLTDGERADATVRRIVVCFGADLVLPGNYTFLGDIYAAGAVTSGSRVVYRGVLADGDVQVAPRSTVLRWLHGEGSVHVGSASTLFGRVSAAQRLTLGPGCYFERLQASRIDSGTWGGSLATDGQAGVPVVARAGDPWHPVGTTLPGSDHVVIGSDTVVPAHATVEASLVARGALRIGEGAVLQRSCKSETATTLQEGVVIRGNVVSEGDVHVGARCVVEGAVIARGSVHLRSGSRIGGPGAPATVSASRVFMERDVTVFGAVWARQGGETEA